MVQSRSRNELTNWLHHLDSYTNAEFGHARSRLAEQNLCVACFTTSADLDVGGLCPRCAAKRRPDRAEVVLFRPLRRG